MTARVLARHTEAVRSLILRCSRGAWLDDDEQLLAALLAQNEADTLERAEGVATAHKIEARARADSCAETGQGVSSGLWQAREHEARDIAAAIRALGGQP